ncbi:hypothetical protein GALMADRAFT_272943 [Galerina marginata CBS 339.88]|uniref:Uncharacterized protein n=1 Tax=Galerina marginata (strain CBS 339.88) TaxID=685588 RepID=A0A067SM50_GALM3|nr:hypothetical protein GALMADRAFT_272943 [Galerina marginata CBS 339.88]
MSATILTSPGVPTAMPVLSRADDSKMPLKELEERRWLSVAIESVYYEHIPGPEASNRCTVLLNLTFVLPRNELLAFARVPLSTHEPTAPDGSFSVSGIPSGHEPVRMGTASIKKQTHFTPTVNVAAPPFQVEVGGMGQDRERSHQEDYEISLLSFLPSQGSQPPLVEFHFENRHAVFYPKAIKLLVQVQKNRNPSDSFIASFPFQLFLSWDLHVDVHDMSVPHLIKRLISKLQKHDGWKFNIKGKYRETLAQDAIRDAGRLPECESIIVGLKAAVRPFLR